MHGIDRAAGGGGGDHREQTAGENTEATLFTFHIQAAVGAQRQQVGLPRVSAHITTATQRIKISVIAHRMARP